MKPLINLDHVKIWQKHTASRFDSVRYHSFNWTDPDYTELEPLSSAEVEKIVRAYYQGKHLYDQLVALRQVCLDILGGKLRKMRADWNENLGPEPFDPFAEIECLFDNSEQPEALPPKISQYAELLAGMKNYCAYGRDAYTKQQQVEGALKYYNRFYNRVHAIINLHRQTKNKTQGVKSCARKILMLFEAEETIVANPDGMQLIN